MYILKSLSDKKEVRELKVFGCFSGSTLFIVTAVPGHRWWILNSLFIYSGGT